MQIIFIRHGEKTKSDPVHLSDKGYKRAENLPQYLLHPYGEFNIPTHAYVMFVGEEDPGGVPIPKEGKSERCWETMQPTLKATTTGAKLPFTMVPRYNTHTLASKFLEMASLRENSSKTFIVCWQHSRIVDFLNVLGARSVSSWGLNPEASRDDKLCFNATWVCDMGRPTSETTLRLRVYRQFDIVNGEPHYMLPRNVAIFDKEYTCSSLTSCSKGRKSKSMCSVM
jgi:hypothetical protein